MITDVYTVFEDALTRVLSENEYSLESTSLLSSARVEMNKVFDAAKYTHAVMNADRRAGRLRAAR